MDGVDVSVMAWCQTLCHYADGLLNDTHLMFKHPPFLVDAHKWCDNKVETRDVHAALKPLHGSQ